MSLNHSFQVISKDDHTFQSCFQKSNRKNRVELHDDLLFYIGDSLRWILTKSPFQRDRNIRGLNLWGVTIIEKRGALRAAIIFETWAQLFRKGPAKLCLTGGWVSIVGKPESGKYSTIRLRRSVLVGKLNRLAKMCREVAESKGRLRLLHCGI